MNTTRMMCGVALAAMLALGCDRSDNTTSPTPAPPAPDVTPKAGGDTAGGAGTTADTGGATTPASSDVPSETATPAAPTTRPTGGGGGDAPPEADAKAAEQTKQAQDLLDKAMAAMKDKRYAEARASLDKVQAMGGDLPGEVRQQAETTRKSLDNLEKAPAETVAPPAPPDEENK